MSIDLQKRLEVRLNELQYGNGEQYLVFQPVPCGLGGQIHGRVLTLALALALGRKGVFLTEDDPPYCQTLEIMHTKVELDVRLDEKPLVDISKAQPDQIVRHDPMHLRTEEPHFYETLLARISREINSEVPSWRIIEGILFNWMKPLPDLELYCNSERLRLGVDEGTLGVHFRRGDKAVESAFVPAILINNEIARIHHVWPFSKLFLASDSPNAADEIICPPGVQLIFDVSEPRHNNANHKMLLNAPELVKQETRVAFKNIKLLASCGGIVGQDNAHFATLAASSILSRTGRVEGIKLLNGRIAERNSQLVFVYYAVKRRLRAVARRIFPQFSIQARMARK